MNEFEQYEKRAELSEWIFQNSKDVRPIVARIEALEAKVLKYQEVVSVCRWCGQRPDLPEIEQP